MAQRQELTDQERLSLKAKGYKNPDWFLRYFLEEQFPSEIPWFHLGIIAILTKQTDFLLKYPPQVVDKIVGHFVWTSPEGPVPLFTRTPSGIDLKVTKYSMIMVPRGFAKTTLCGFGIVLFWVLYQDADFILYVSESNPHAESQLRSVRVALELNERIRAVFGNLVPEGKSTNKWTDELLETSSGVAITCRGRGGQVRGLNIRGKRPKKVIVDDLEDRESVSTEIQRQKCRSWFHGDLKPVLPRNDPNAGVMALGTLIHNDSLLVNLEKDPQWTCVKFGAIDKDGDLLWPAMMNAETLEKEKFSYASQGELHTFYMEFLSEVTVSEQQKFRRENIIITPPTSDVVCTAIAMDPAVSENLLACHATIAVVSMLRNGKINVREMWGKIGPHPRELIDKYFELEAKYLCNKHGIESNAFQAALVHLMREEMFRPQKDGVHRRHFEIIPLTHRTKKIVRVEAILAPRYANKYIEHSQRFPELETQLLGWPREKMDFPDVLAMAVALLDPFAAQVATDRDLATDQYEDLDDLFEGDWRSSQYA